MTHHTETLAEIDRPVSLLAQVEAADPEIADRLVTSRAATAAAVGLVTAPVALAVLANDAFGQGRLPLVLVNVLNFALTLEYLERDFYLTGTGTKGLIPASDQTIFQTIASHESQHVSALAAALGSAAKPKPAFDFTGGKGSGKGPYADVFTSYNTFLGVAQAFEDTGVRAYKGQAPSLLPYKGYLATALGIHSVEARHASEVRRLRGQILGNAEQAPNKGWITRNLTDIPGTAATYAGEDNTVQGGVDLTKVSSASLDNITEGWDEPLTAQQVLAIAGNFIA